MKTYVEKEKTSHFQKEGMKLEEEKIKKDVIVSQALEEKKIKKGIVTSPILNVREKPKETSNPFMILTEGIEVEIDKSFNDSKWFKIKTSTGSVGYVAQGYIKEK